MVRQTLIHNDALVAQVNADGILRWDFMLSNSCSTDVSHKVLLFKDKKKIPLLVQSYIGCDQITANKTVSILSKALQLIRGQMLKDDNRIPTNSCLVELFAPGPPKEGFVMHC